MHSLSAYLKYRFQLKFIYSEKAIKFCEIFPLLLTVCTVVNNEGKISQNFVAFSEYTYELYKGLQKKYIYVYKIYKKMGA